MLLVYDFELCSESKENKPFDVGYEAGASGMTIFDCPYPHETVEGLRSRHEWLNGFLTATSQKGSAGFL